MESRVSPTMVTRTYLEMRSADELRAAPAPRPAPRIERIGECPASFFRYLYEEVGRAFHWTDRISWSDETIRVHLNTPGVSVWLMSWRAAPAGYFELRQHQDRSVEIAYFGLLPDFIGRGGASTCSRARSSRPGGSEPIESGSIPAPWTIPRRCRIMSSEGSGRSVRRSTN